MSNLIRKDNRSILDRFFGDSLIGDDPFDRMLESFWNTPHMRMLNYPIVKDGMASYTVEVPGMTEADLKISWHEGMLKVEGKSEKYNKTISHAVTLDNINAETLEATCENGMLTITAKVLTPEDKSIQVPINRKQE